MQYDYVRLINEFCDYKGYPDLKRRTLLRDEIIQCDLFNASIEEIRELIVYGLKATKYETIKNYISLLNQFFKWCRTEKGININSPFSSELLQIRNLSYYAIKDNPLPVVTDALLETYISRLNDNKEYFEVLLRAFYEGITAEDICRLKKKDINIKERFIITSKGRLNISSRFADAIQQYYTKFVVYITPGRKLYVKELFPGAFITDGVANAEKEIPSDKLLSWYNQKSTNLLRTVIRDQIGVSLSKRDLRHNGFISLVQRKYDGDIERTAQAFLVETRGKENAAVLYECAEEYQLSDGINDIRSRCYSYVISRYMQK